MTIYSVAPTVPGMTESGTGQIHGPTETGSGRVQVAAEGDIGRLTGAALGSLYQCRGAAARLGTPARGDHRRPLPDGRSPMA